MNFIEKIKQFIRKILNKKQQPKMLEAPQIKENIQNNNEMKTNNFFQSLKVNQVQEKKKDKIKTLVCVGDGLGIKPKMSS